MQIREATIHDAAALAHLISLANKEVATRFDLNANNCPKHPSFCTEAWVQADFTRGERYFILENESSALGCVAYEQAKAEIAYLNRLSVLPEQQRKGIGSRLVEHIVQLAKTTGTKTISIGVIGEHPELQHWYRERGFQTGETRHFSHLPFSVTYMTFTVDNH